MKRKPSKAKADITTKKKSNTELLREYWEHYDFYFNWYPYNYDTPDNWHFEKMAEYEAVLGKDLCRAHARAMMSKKNLKSFEQHEKHMHRVVFWTSLVNILVVAGGVGFFLYSNC